MECEILMKTAYQFVVGVIFFSLTLLAAPLWLSEALASATPPAVPEEQSSHGIPQLKDSESVAGQIGHKLVRGVANIMTGWVEMPKQMYLKTTQGPPVMGTLLGIVEGVGLGFARTTAGLYEIATFALPLPMHYEPLFEPEYVWQDEDEDQAD
jgi:putative exosortase-associated protein (TIGR04073 family)